MQQNETLKVRMPEANEAVRTPGSVQSPAAEVWIDRIKKDLESVKAQEKTMPGDNRMKKERTSPESNKEPGWLQKLNTTVVDMGRDIVTANDMAKSKFDGDSALLHAARGGASTLIGIGLEKVLDDIFQQGIRENGELWFGRTPIRMSPTIAKNLKEYEKGNPRMHNFIVNATKDLFTGTVYNGMAFFSRPMLPSVEGKHLVASLGVNATEAIFTKDLDYPNRMKQAQEKLDLVTQRRDQSVKTWSELVQQGGDEAKKDELLQSFIRDNTTIRNTQFPADGRWRWQTLLRQYTTYSNPATLLGLEMIGQSMFSLVQNFKEVQKVRKEKGGLAGKQVHMPKDEGRRSYGDRKPWTNNREQGNRPPYNKGTVYYGQGRSHVDAKQQEEEDRAKLM